MNENSQRVLKFVQELLVDEDAKGNITPTLIAEHIATVTAMRPRWEEGLDKVAVTDELIRRFSVWMGTDTTMKSDADHRPWLDAARKTDWRYWQRYREWLEAKLSWNAADALDRSTDKILGLLEDPLRDGSWDRRGLVVGHVQSGKTGSYTGLVCKAADAGYKIVIVLAGMHNNLRAQTQVRLDEGFLGYETTAAKGGDLTFVGVGAGGRDAAIKPNCATNRSDQGDFNTQVARHLAITPEQRPWLFVVKKNKTVLERILDWIRNHAADSQDPQTGRKIVTHLPLLVIDDEADHASVDTREQKYDSDGQPDPEHDPTVINSRIRQILHSFTRSAYVGYTATPFANIFIHERGVTEDEGPDLFPAAFIMNLAAPSNYVGPARVFGLASTDGRTGGLPLVRRIDDHQDEQGPSGWMPQKHKNGHVPRHDGDEDVPDSLIEAIDAFVLACAARRVRGQQAEHCSMLVHVTRFTSVQAEVFRQVDDQIRHMRQRLLRDIDSASTLNRLEELWSDDFQKTTAAIHAKDPALSQAVGESWADMIPAIRDAIQEIEVRQINGTAKDALDYVQNEGRGLKVIAIGGDKLARGLTLEGLCTSYFLRASRMYDTLMQMGRWFGYRPGYLDLSRLYTTSELVSWFGHITDAAEELRDEFEIMAENGATPREYGLKVQSHPVLTVTSPMKMRTARNLMLSFSGQLLETVTFFRNQAALEKNVEAARRLLAQLSKPEVDPERQRGDSRQQWNGFLWRNVAAGPVIRFLTEYQTHPSAHKVHGTMLSEFVTSMNEVDELTRWTIAVVGGGEGRPWDLGNGTSVDMLKRTENGSDEDRYAIGRLLSGRDETLDLDEPSWLAALAMTRAAWRNDPGRRRAATEPDIPNGPAIRRVRGYGTESIPPRPEEGLLLLYIIDPLLTDLPFAPNAPGIVAFGISFPVSDSGRKVQYAVTNILWEQQYGPAD